MNTSTNKFSVVSGIIILIVTLALFYLDHETQNVGDLFQPGMLVPLLLYTIPTFILCLLLFFGFKKLNVKNSSGLAMALGIPGGIFAVILILSWQMGRL